MLTQLGGYAQKRLTCDVTKVINYSTLGLRAGASPLLDFLAHRMGETYLAVTLVIN
jgi:hypothetical protein